MSPPIDPILRTVLSDTIRRHSTPLQPLPTGVEPILAALEGVRAVLFDVYGTLFVSGSGDIGTTDVDSRPGAFGEALEAVGVPFAGDSDVGVQWLSETIAAHHERSRRQGIEHPEVDIREVWEDVLKRLSRAGVLGEAGHLEETTLLALEYEVRTNPVWPMPSALDTLHRLREAELTLGIVSNAQVFTRLLFPALLGESLDAMGFGCEMCVWSYEHRQAKPGTFLYERARDALQGIGVSAHQVLYIGNDMLKDIWPARHVGFRTALFAGDARSYRPRPGDPRVAGERPHLVVTELAQLPECVLDER